MCTTNSNKSLKKQYVTAFQTIQKTVCITLYGFMLFNNTLIFSSSLPTTSSTPLPGSTINYNFTASPNVYASSDQKNAQDASLLASHKSIHETKTNVTQKTTVDQNINQTVTLKLELPDMGFAKFKQDCVDLCNSSCRSMTKNFYDMIIEHKWKLIALTLTASYGVVFYKIYQIEQHLQQYNSWCNWKSAVPLPHLMLTPTTDLISQLNFDMHSKYGLVIKNICDTSTIPDLFLHDLQEEINLLERYVSLLDIASMLHCNRLFYFKYCINFIEEKKARLTFVYNLFIMIQAQQKK